MLHDYAAKNIEKLQMGFFKKKTGQITGENMRLLIKQDCSYQGEALNVPTAF